MTARNPSPGRRPETSKRGPLPAIGQDAIAGQPFPPKHWRERTAILHRQVRASDIAANQLRHQSVEPSLAEHIWLWGGALVGLIVGLVLVWL